MTRKLKIELRTCSIEAAGSIQKAAINLVSLATFSVQHDHLQMCN